ncbi:hypothetical protein [Yoonia sp.]|uniref:hypothetical protein n=1 Tax=Yoonia sp. TaxID=2212373 RepID=UPI002E046372|nr:hypothetical protein [Yoonia sp.]
MKRLIAASLFAFLPLPALGDTDCAKAWTEIRAFAASFGVTDLTGSVTSGAEGWCRFATSDETLFQRANAEGKFRFAVSEDARSGEVVFSRQETPLGPIDGRLAVTQDIRTGSVQLDELHVQGEDGRALRMRGQLHAATFENVTQAQEALAEMTFTTVSLDFTVTPDALADLRIDLSDVTRSSVDTALRGVGEAQVSGRTKREFLRFVGAVPNARGTLRVTMDAHEARPVAALIAPFFALGHAPGEAALTKAFAAGLDDTTLTVIWNPGRM